MLQVPYDTSGRLDPEDVKTFVDEMADVMKSMQKPWYSRAWEWVRVKVLRRKPRWLVIHITDGLKPGDFAGQPMPKEQE